MTDEHHGELTEAEYGFFCWTTCGCGWRSKSYRSSGQAWQAHDAHRGFEADWEQTWERFMQGER
jgi:hypothetical protein